MMIKNEKITKTAGKVQFVAALLFKRILVSRYFTISMPPYQTLHDSST